MATCDPQLAEPSLGPVQALEVYDALVAKIEAVLEHRRMLVQLRTLRLHYIADQLAKLPTEIRDQLDAHGKVQARLVRLGQLAITPRQCQRPPAATGCRGCGPPSMTIVRRWQRSAGWSAS